MRLLHDAILRMNALRARHTASRKAKILPDPLSCAYNWSGTAYLECGTFLIQLHDHLLLALVRTAGIDFHGLVVQLHLPCLVQAGSEGLHLAALRLLQLQMHLQMPPKPVSGRDDEYDGQSGLAL